MCDLCWQPGRLLPEYSTSVNRSHYKPVLGYTLNRTSPTYVHPLPFRYTTPPIRTPFPRETPNDTPPEDSSPGITFTITNANYPPAGLPKGVAKRSVVRAPCYAIE